MQYCTPTARTGVDQTNQLPTIIDTGRNTRQQEPVSTERLHEYQ
jgi:hypothetical protein